MQKNSQFSSAKLFLVVQFSFLSEILNNQAPLQNLWLPKIQDSESVQDSSTRGGTRTFTARPKFDSTYT